MKTVYLVTTGDYSDYSVKAAFSIEQKAALYAKFVGGDVEPFEVDADNVPGWYDPRLSVFECRVLVSDPSQEIRAIMLTAKWVGSTGAPDAINTVNAAPVWDGNGNVPALRVNVQARDKAHAIKIAAEKFAEYKARQADIA